MSTEKSSKSLVILGPTSSGKSSLAIDVAKQWNGEIISADSRQVYRGMDIGTGKVPKDTLQQTTDNEPQEISGAALSAARCELYVSEGVPHHLLDVADPNDDYNISHFLRDARAAIGDIASRGKLPIVCGGTGFWIQALVEHQTLPNIPPDPSLREALSQKTPEELFEMLARLDPKRTEIIDQKNPRRLIRAIEIAKFKEQDARSTEQKPPDPRSLIPTYCSLILALCPPKDILDAKIKARLDARFAEGMIDEVAQLHENNISWERLDAFGLEYRWISRFLRGIIDEQEMKERLFFDSIHYAKRQMTWIRRWQKSNPTLHIVATKENALALTEEFLKKEICPKTLSGS